MELWYLIVLLISFGGICWLLHHWLVKRYKYRWSTRTIVFAFLFSVIPSLFVFNYLNTNLPVDPTKWQQITQLDQPITQLLYQPDEGLFAVVHNKRVKITRTLPFCPPDSRFTGHTDSPIIKSTSNPRITLPPPSQLPSHQVTFEFVYPHPKEDIGVVSYTAFSNGEIWCAAKLGFHGIDVYGFRNYISRSLSAVIFMGSFAIITYVIVMILDFHWWRKQINLSSNSKKAA